MVPLLLVQKTTVNADWLRHRCFHMLPFISFLSYCAMGVPDNTGDLQKHICNPNSKFYAATMIMQFAVHTSHLVSGHVFLCPPTCPALGCCHCVVSCVSCLLFCGVGLAASYVSLARCMCVVFSEAWPSEV